MSLYKKDGTPRAPWGSKNGRRKLADSERMRELEEEMRGVGASEDNASKAAGLTRGKQDSPYQTHELKTALCPASNSQSFSNHAATVSSKELPKQVHEFKEFGKDSDTQPPAFRKWRFVFDYNFSRVVTFRKPYTANELDRLIRANQNDGRITFNLEAIGVNMHRVAYYEGVPERG